MARGSPFRGLSGRGARSALVVLWLVAVVCFSAPTLARETDSSSSSAASSPAAQSLPDESLADDEWLSGVDRSWDPEYSEQWYQLWGPAETGRWSLSVSAGAAEGRVRRWGWQGAEQLPSSTGGLNAHQRELYALALLELPMGGWQRDARAALQLPPGERGGLQLPLVRDAEGVASEREGSSEQEPAGADALVGNHPQSEAPEAVSVRSDESDGPVGVEERANAELLELTRLLREHIRKSPHTLAELSRLRSLARRSRHSGMVPELRLRGVLGFDQTTSLEDAGAIVPGETTTRGARDSLVEARLTFRLDHLVYGSSETALDRRRAQVLERIRDEQRAATRLLIEWIRAMRRVHDPTLLPEEVLAREDEQRAALIELHLLTDGWFEGSATLRSLGLRELLNSLEDAPSEEKR